jgi:zinc finger protein
LLLVESPFTLILEDISGNCCVENPNAPQTDANLSIVHFVRTTKENHDLGIFTHAETGETEDNILKPIKEDEWTLEDIQGEVMQFPTNCPECTVMCMTNMKVTNIPHFKEVIIMATNCDACGHRTNEVKGGGGIEDKGVRIDVKVRSSADFSRDVLKVSFSILEIEKFNKNVVNFRANRAA